MPILRTSIQELVNPFKKKLQTATIEHRDGKWQIKEKYQGWRDVTKEDIAKRPWIGAYVNPESLPK